MATGGGWRCSRSASKQDNYYQGQGHENKAEHGGTPLHGPTIKLPPQYPIPLADKGARWPNPRVRPTSWGYFGDGDSTLPAGTKPSDAITESRGASRPAHVRNPRSTRRRGRSPDAPGSPGGLSRTSYIPGDWEPAGPGCWTPGGQSAGPSVRQTPRPQRTSESPPAPGGQDWAPRLGRSKSRRRGAECSQSHPLGWPILPRLQRPTRFRLLLAYA